MKSIEATGKTVKEAINKGLETLGCDAGDVDVQVLEMGTPGLFGLFGKPAKVKLTVKAKDDEIEMPVFSLDGPAKQKEPKKVEKTEQKKPEPKKEKTETKPAKSEKPAKQPKKAVETEPVEEKAEAEAAPAPKQKKPRRERKERTESPVAENPVVVAPPIAVEPFVETAEEALTETAKSAREFLSGLTEKMGVPAQIAVCETPEQLRMVLSGENMSILIGRRGDTLDAIQYLTSLYVNRNREDYLRVSLDTENYRAKREEALRKLAVRMAGRCKKNGRRVALEPMNPYERRILHSALQADPDVTTHSEGEEPYRRVIITLK